MHNSLGETCYHLSESDIPLSHPLAGVARENDVSAVGAYLAQEPDRVRVVHSYRNRLNHVPIIIIGHLTFQEN